MYLLIYQKKTEDPIRSDVCYCDKETGHVPTEVEGLALSYKIQSLVYPSSTNTRMLSADYMDDGNVYFLHMTLNEYRNAKYTLNGRVFNKVPPELWSMPIARLVCNLTKNLTKDNKFGKTLSDRVFEHFHKCHGFSSLLRQCDADVILDKTKPCIELFKRRYRSLYETFQIQRLRNQGSPAEGDIEVVVVT
jgi:hypothetical protein